MNSKFKFLLFLLVKALTISGVVSDNCRVPEKIQNAADGVCGNIDIRNEVSSLRKLENCTVIEGYLHISLIERVDLSDYDQYSFPKLIEITDHLMLYRVWGLKTLRHLFPNLAVIRGRIPFNNYALVAYEMQDLEEIGLFNLRSIGGGGVRLTKNKKLCYIETVDWTRLGVDPTAQDFKDNKEESQCANYCPEDCTSTKIRNTEAKRCWTSQHCQKNLNCRCKAGEACMDNGTCCHQYCLGGCTGPGIGNCLSCKGVVYKNSCQPQCPPHTYMFFKRRCLLDKECLALRNRTDSGGGNSMILRGEKEVMPSMCVFKCPENYVVREDGELKNAECVKCQGFCPKVCNGTEVNSIQDAAQNLDGCSKIVGCLVIQIMGGSNVAQQMEKYLGNIKEVTGYIHIRRSYALLTLYFFKNLEIIGGEPLMHQGHSLVVMDNSNLQELFPEEQMAKMKIKNGKVSFHGNRKLCLYKIKNFIEQLNLSEPPTENDVSSATNGDLKPCMEHNLNLSVSTIFYSSVVLMWDKDTGDSRQLLSYIINYKEIKDKNVDINIYQGRDACSDDAWLTTEQQPTNNKETFQTGVILSLKPYTTYAVYIQAYTLSTASHSAMSKVIMFTTNPWYPTEPTELQVSSDDPEELHVKWKPPKDPNGVVTHYKVVYRKQKLDPSSFEQRNYCLDPILAPQEETKDTVEEEDKKLNLSANCCACPKSQEEIEAEKRRLKMEVFFEDYLQKHIYCKRYDVLPEDILFNENFSLPRLSELPDFTAYGGTSHKGKDSSNTAEALVPYTTNKSGDKDNEETEETVMDKNSTSQIQETVVYETEAVLPNLDHFQEYSIEVQACQDSTGDEKIGKLCSNRAITLGRTKASWVMDRINTSTIEVELITNSSGDVLIKWKPPAHPNGLILKYNLFYKRANQENLVPQQVCVNIRQYKKFSGHRLTGLSPGNWTFQIKPVSLAGNGTFSPERFFIIPTPPGAEDSHTMLIAAVVVVVLGVIGCGLFVVYIFAKHRHNHDELTVISPNINYVPSAPTYTTDGWEVDRDKIKLIRELGQGSFGMVYEGIASGIGDDPDEEISVAVKTVNDRASFNDRREFLKEATTMKAFDCFHVVKLLGVVSTSQPALVIMELMALGDLKHYLREHRPDEERPGVSPPRLLDILQMAGEIADGMAYLTNKKFLHRDLAARNCMVSANRTVKVGDFGMARDVYETDYYRKGGKGMLPVRWMAPESLKDGVFTTKSDVWSYGVVMWEMVTLAAQPYQGMSNEEVVKYISDGNTMGIPDKCPDEMAYLMERCWEKKPKNRPSFIDIIMYLLPHLNSQFEKVSYFFSRSPEGEGTTEGILGQQDEGSDIASSINSLSCEGAAAPRHSMGEQSGHFQSQGSLGDFTTNPMFTQGKLHDDFSDEEEGNRYYPQSGDFARSFSDMYEESFEDRDVYGSPRDDGLDADDVRKPFMFDEFQSNPVSRNLPSSLPVKGDDGSRSSGLLELQPLINTDRNTNPSSPPRLNNVQCSQPFSSNSISHQQPSTLSQNVEPGLQSSQQHNIFNPARVELGASMDNSSGLSDRSRPKKHFTAQMPVSSSSSNSSRSTKRLPTLNQPPSGGFRRAGAYNSGNKDKSSCSMRNGQSSSNESHPTIFVPASANSVSEEQRLHDPEESGTGFSSQRDSPQLGAFISSSEGSKESSKSSGSHSLMNGLTNGHIPLPAVKHRTAPC